MTLLDILLFYFLVWEEVKVTNICQNIYWHTEIEKDDLTEYICQDAWLIYN